MRDRGADDLPDASVWHGGFIFPTISTSIPECLWQTLCWVSVRTADRLTEWCFEPALAVNRRTVASGGAVAQLGERLVRNEEVRGSTPLGSTTGYRSSARDLLLPRDWRPHPVIEEGREPGAAGGVIDGAIGEVRAARLGIRQ